MRTLLVAMLALPIAACGVDSYLTCGAPCEDGGANDATTTSDSGSVDSGKSDAADAGNDVSTTDSGCKADGGYCQKGSDCCSSACNASNHCAPSCAPQGSSCGSNSACCVGMFCGDGGCVACLQENAPCTQDYQCCGGGSCTGGFDGGSKTCSGN